MGDTTTFNGKYEPTDQEWDGKGRPPVGVRCLVPELGDVGFGRFVKATVIWHRKENDVDALVLSDDERSTWWVDEFRPIRTKEQREREEVIKQAAEVIANGYSLFYLGADGAAQRLYDAGMLRKPEGE